MQMGRINKCLQRIRGLKRRPPRSPTLDPTPASTNTQPVQKGKPPPRLCLLVHETNERWQQPLPQIPHHYPLPCSKRLQTRIMMGLNQPLNEIDAPVPTQEKESSS